MDFWFEPSLTFLLPHQRPQLEAAMRRTARPPGGAEGPRLWVVKSADANRGEGVRLISHPSQLQGAEGGATGEGRAADALGGGAIAQPYLENPLLIDGLWCGAARGAGV